MESFFTIQGEGFYSGTPAYFIRLGGCDVGCVWCDVKESWEASDHPEVDILKMVEQAKSSGTKVVVVTGGEPLMYDLTSLTDVLKQSSLQTNVETAGVYPITGNWDWICFSPKKFKAPLAEYYQQANELKVIIYNKSDFSWAEEHASKMNAEAQLYLQPEWGKRNAMMPLIVDYVKKNPKWRISLQTHKYLNIP
ncbi:7-carboxy-7-deazaguanine synthase QueE [Marinoscillum sp. MHG1-6]|uniref:7-carboxy-7-deazaguanine synthase QueE n=1 Tax=Marinoscillum sp. MHG1-6 TaxID=2959627 RepID=UPI0021576839|nr:7-carboxy-7-deazaguanine synthase QueE [Marinoscillum sp. MHG1-6]